MKTTSKSTHSGRETVGMFFLNKILQKKRDGYHAKYTVHATVFSGNVVEANVSSSRLSELPVHFKERPANDPKCVVIHSSEDQLASFKNFVVIHSVFSGVIIETQ
ncbi:hypothetical protein TNCV_3150821 [Trichonephila clavipes]|nr:hypothetical protein TNCV_3150821 [Trichonephila clavipes]